MQQALYHLEHGYYASGRAAIGRGGDYFTNVSVGPLFGRLLTIQFTEVWERLGKIDGFTIVEQGAHDGEFARDVLESARERFPDLFAALRYRIIEPFPALQRRQTQILKRFREKVEWAETMRPFVGVHFSNELLDALPVNLREKRVCLDNDELVFAECAGEPEAKPNQAALAWTDTVARNLQRGVVIVVDYGFTRSAFRESLQVRAKHRHVTSPFEQIGYSDITMHVNWTDIAERAEANGLRVAGFTDQHHFLAGIIAKFPDLIENAKARRELQTLLHPEMLGRAFQVLALSKNVDADQLCGFKFARDARAALEL
jgi:SAM-dependent MidA family methyltransferase